jgi:transposase
MFVMAFEREYTETFWEGHARAFEFFGGVPRKITYDNTRVAGGAVVPAASAARWWNVKCQMSRCDPTSPALSAKM